MDITSKYSSYWNRWCCPFLKIAAWSQCAKLLSACFLRLVYFWLQWQCSIQRIHFQHEKCIHCVHSILRWWRNAWIFLSVVYQFALKYSATAFRSRLLIKCVLLFTLQLTLQLRSSYPFFFSSSWFIGFSFHESGKKCTGIKCFGMKCLVAPKSLHEVWDFWSIASVEKQQLYDTLYCNQEAIHRLVHQLQEVLKCHFLSDHRFLARKDLDCAGSRLMNTSLRKSMKIELAADMLSTCMSDKLTLIWILRKNRRY